MQILPIYKMSIKVRLKAIFEICLFLAFVSSISSTHQAYCQASSVFHFNLDGSGSEKDPVIYAKPSGGYYLAYRIVKSSPDSAFLGVASLDNALQPVWNKVYKSLANAVASKLIVGPSGFSFVLNGYNTQSRYFSAWLKLDNSGNELERVQLADSSVLNSGSSISSQIELDNRSTIFTSSVNSKIFRVNASGNIDYARSFYLAGNPNRSLQITKLLTVPQSNTWYAIGQISNTSLGFFLQFQDTTLVANRIYAGNPGFTGFLRDGAVLPNGDLQLLGAQGITLRRVNAVGIPLWTKFHKVIGSFPQAQHVGADGSIWVTGSLTAGQAGGLVASFSTDGNYINHTGQFKLGFSHEPIRSMLPYTQGQMLLVQKGYYNNSNVILGNQITTGSDFVCFDYLAGSISDTNYVTTDSSSTKIRWNVERFGKSSNIGFPIQVRNLNLVRGPVSCSQVSVEENLAAHNIRVYPNPTKNRLMIEGLTKPVHVKAYNPTGQLVFKATTDGELILPELSPGVYVINLPELGYKIKVLIGI